MASSARNIVRCLKPNGLGTRPRSSIPLRVRTYYVRERNKQGRSSWRPWDLQSSYIWNAKVPREPILRSENEGEKFFPRFALTDRRYAPLCTASGSVSYMVPPPLSINPISAPDCSCTTKHWLSLILATSSHVILVSSFRRFNRIPQLRAWSVSPNTSPAAHVTLLV